MTEIKSTLDLILEKMKSFEISKDERDMIKKRDIRGKISRLLKRCLNNDLKLERFKEELHGIDGVSYEQVKEILKEEIIQNFDIRGRNLIIIDILKEILNIDISSILDELNLELKEKERQLIRERLDELKDKEIYGSALIPNIEGDPKWLRFLKQKEEEIHHRLKEILNITDKETRDF